MSWRKIKGPDAYAFEHADSLKTKVSGLATGHYQFELTVTDEQNLSGRDTVTVSVGEMPVNPNEFIFRYQVWVPTWFSSIEIKKFQRQYSSRK